MEEYKAKHLRTLIALLHESGGVWKITPERIEALEDCSDLLLKQRKHAITIAKLLDSYKHGEYRWTATAEASQAIYAIIKEINKDRAPKTEDNDDDELMEM